MTNHDVVPLDRRARRSRRLLREALVELSLEKGYASLTVEEIAQRADLGRGTFYAHFKDKDELLSEIVEDMLVSLRECVDPPTENASPEPFTGQPLQRLFQLALSDRDRYLLVLGGAGDGAALRLFFDLLADWSLGVISARCKAHGKAPRTPLDLIARSWSGAVIGVLGEWLAADERLPVEVITDQFRSLETNGRRWAMGYGSPPGSD
ncbi:TetR/AcrR family transcriptional regulator [Dietzia maris]